MFFLNILHKIIDSNQKIKTYAQSVFYDSNTIFKANLLFINIQ